MSGEQPTPNEVLDASAWQASKMEIGAGEFRRALEEEGLELDSEIEDAVLYFAGSNIGTAKALAQRCRQEGFKTKEEVLDLVTSLIREDYIPSQESGNLLAALTPKPESEK